MNFTKAYNPDTSQNRTKSHIPVLTPTGTGTCINLVSWQTSKSPEFCQQHLRVGRSRPTVVEFVARVRCRECVNHVLLAEFR